MSGMDVEVVTVCCLAAEQGEAVDDVNNLPQVDECPYRECPASWCDERIILI